MNISKVLEGAKCCLHGTACYFCPYNDHLDGCSECKKKLMSDLMKAIVTIKKKNTSRLLSLEEVKKLPRASDVWLELSTNENEPTIITAVTVEGIGSNGISYFLNSYSFSTYNRRTYGWRCWTGRPTEKQIKEELWIN